MLSEYLYAARARSGQFHWAPVRHGLTEWIRGFPNARATTTWLAIVTATQLVLTHGSERLDGALLRSASTNLHNLRVDPISVLIISACFVPTFWSYIEFVLASVLLLAPLENWIGTKRWLIGLVLGHVGSTLAVAIGLWVSSMRSGNPDTRAIDVGVSYGVWFLVAVLVQRWPALFRVNASLVVLLAVIGVVLGGSFSDYGHLVAVISGLILGPVLLRGLESTTRA